MFTQAELERANHDMQARLLSVSEQILHELSHLERQMAGAPAGVRASALSAAAQIASTQQRLRDQAQHLPTSPLRRFQILRSSLDAQQGALRQLSIIVQAHAPPSQPAPIAVSQAVAAPQQPASAPAHVADPVPNPPQVAPPVQFQMPAPAAPATSSEPVWEAFDSDPSEESEPPPPTPQASRRRRGLRGAVERIGSRTLALVAILAAGAVVSYGMFPRASEPDAAPTRRLARAQPGPSAAATPSAPAAVPPSPQLPAEQPAAAREPVPTVAPKEETPVAAAAPAPPAPSQPLQQQPFMPGLMVTLPAPAPPAAAPAPAQPGPPRAEASTPAPSAAPATPAPAGEVAAKQQFVPVVLTHKDDAEARRAFADLQRQFPKLLGNRRGEAQPVDLGQKGIWHRLVVLPPAAHPQAARLCDQLLGAGYDRCWVKAY